MAKRFKSKRSGGRSKVIFFVLLITLSFAMCLSYFSHLFQKEEFLNFMLSSMFKDEKSINETSVFDYLLDYTIGKSIVTDEVYDGAESLQEYIPDPTPEENKTNPRIYLYNTHQGEEYTGDTLSEHDIVPTVMLAGYRLREELNKMGLNTIMETNQISEVLRINSWNYASSYQASKLLMSDAYEKNPTLEYFIDLHRDAIPYESSVVTYGDKTYAKVLFVIGTDHDGYQENLALASKIHEKLNVLVPNVSRGVMTKGGDGVNGIYNQDFSSKTLLFEIGGQYNKISEVNNTVILLAQVLKEIIGD